MTKKNNLLPERGAFLLTNELDETNIYEKERVVHIGVYVEGKYVKESITVSKKGNEPGIPWQGDIQAT